MKKIFIQGYANSGMTALRDFLSEFESNYILNDEFDLLRHVDGILSLENQLTVNNGFWDDASIKRFRHFVDYLNRPSAPGVLGRNWKKLIGEDFLKISNEFISNLVRSEQFTEIQYYNPHAVDDLRQKVFSYYNYFRKFTFFRLFLRSFGKDKLMGSSVIFVNSFTKDEFVLSACDYLEKVFTLMENKEVITLMHPLLISGDIEHQLKYFRNAKVVVSNRDPRDVYVDVSTKGVEYIPWRNLEDFVFWFKKWHANYPLTNNVILNINFEDLVLNYDDTSSKIIEFLELNEFQRSPKTIFKPEISINNVGLYHAFKDQDAILFIERELSEYCYTSLNKP